MAAGCGGSASRSVTSSWSAGTSSGSPSDVEHVPLGHVADGHADGRTGVGDLGAAHQAVGRLQRDRTHHVVADVLGNLQGERLGQLAELDAGGERVVEVRDAVRGRTRRPRPGR
jgi:hypothetical protein